MQGAKVKALAEFLEAPKRLSARDQAALVRNSAAVGMAFGTGFACRSGQSGLESWSVSSIDAMLDHAQSSSAGRVTQYHGHVASMTSVH